MNVHKKNEWWCRAGWFLTVVAAGLIIHFMPGCGGALPKADEAKAAGCLEDIDYAIAEGFSCQAVVANVVELTRRRPECTAILGKAGITLVCHDGGSRD